jgi:hypothetical protein
MLALAGLLVTLSALPAAAQDREPARGSVARSFEAKSRKGMAYAQFRKQVLAAGWQAEGSEDCADSAGAQACKALPELDRCTDGTCLMSFVHPDEDAVLRVAAKGSAAAAGKAGAPGISLDDWGFE